MTGGGYASSPSTFLPPHSSHELTYDSMYGIPLHTLCDYIVGSYSYALVGSLVFTCELIISKAQISLPVPNVHKFIFPKILKKKKMHQVVDYQNNGDGTYILNRSIQGKNFKS